MRVQPKGSHFIAGQFVDDPKGEAFTSTYPATGKVLAELTTATDELVDKAVLAAEAAQQEWAAMPPAERGRIAVLAHLFEDDLLDLCRLGAARIDDLHRKISRPGPLGRDRHETVGDAICRVALLIVGQPVLERVDDALDMRRQTGGGFQSRPLRRVERHELQRDGKPLLKPEPWAELGSENVIEVQRAGLKLGAQRLVDTAGHAVLDLVPDLKQEADIRGNPARDRASGMVETPLQVPVSLLSTPRPTVGIPIIYAFASEPGVQQIGPADHGGNDKQLGPESQARAVESMNGGDHRLARLYEQLVAPSAETSLGVMIRPGADECVQLLRRRGPDCLVLFVFSDLAYQAMIDRAAGPGELGKDVLLIPELCLLRQHRLDDSHLPTGKCVASAPSHAPLANLALCELLFAHLPCS